MALALAEKYSALSLRDCLRPHERAEERGALGDPHVDLPLASKAGERNFAVPPGIEVSIRWNQLTARRLYEFDTVIPMG